MRSKILLITGSLEANPRGGREQLCKLNHDCLVVLCNDGLTVFNLSKVGNRMPRSIVGALRGYIDGLNVANINIILHQVHSLNISCVFVDGSNLGAVVAELKKRMPDVQIITFFHNVEARFFWGALLSYPSIRAFGVFLANLIAERKAAIYSDKLICLSDRDSNLLKKIYGRSASHIAPMALEDKCPPTSMSVKPLLSDTFALFVGANFYANRKGICWFAREVVPRINIPVVIVGRGFEVLRSELEGNGNITVVGTVNNLSNWYQRAQFIIAPIFDGSGMKTKVAEALMHGKKIIGTPEAFSGYEDIIEQAGWICYTADEFVEAITVASTEIVHSFYPELRTAYERYYSVEAAKSRLMQILE
jgi:glycosyltransferase involved in cell wall biosynthesis